MEEVGQSTFKIKETAKTIISLLPHRTRKPATFSKKNIDRYLYTFAFEVGADLPSEDILRTIYKLLMATDQSTNEATDFVQEERMQILV